MHVYTSRVWALRAWSSLFNNIEDRDGVERIHGHGREFGGRKGRARKHDYEGNCLVPGEII